MMRPLAAAAALLTLCLTACDRSPPPPDSPAAEASAARVSPAPPPEASAVDEATAAEAPAEATPAAPGAPGFAVLYPGARADAPATTASGESGDGGMVTFQTSATPDAVMDFYRARAEAAGLRPVMGMNQGEARAYGAADGEPDGARLQVVAAPGDDGQTSVQLSWSEGR